MYFNLLHHTVMVKGSSKKKKIKVEWEVVLRCASCLHCILLNIHNIEESSNKIKKIPDICSSSHPVTNFIEIFQLISEMKHANVQTQPTPHPHPHCAYMQRTNKIKISKNSMSVHIIQKEEKQKCLSVHHWNNFLAGYTSEWICHLAFQMYSNIFSSSWIIAVFLRFPLDLWSYFLCPKETLCGEFTILSEWENLVSSHMKIEY